MNGRYQLCSQFARGLGIVAALSILCLRSSFAQSIIYVDADAVGAEDGTTWQDAYTYLQDALAISAAGDEIWVAEGEYRPDLGGSQSVGDRSSSFELKSGVRLYGGFDGTEVRRSARSVIEHRSVLSGDLAGDDQAGTAGADENSYHVVRANGVDETTLLDGFSIRGGNANGAEIDSLGGGLLVERSSLAVMNVTLMANAALAGGGIANLNATTVLINVIIRANRAAGGGGVYNEGGAPVFASVTVNHNEAVLAGGIYNRDSSPVISNSIIAGNRSSEFATLDCERANYPCTFAEVSDSVYDRGIELGRQALALGSMLEAASWLRERQEVAHVVGDDTAVRFRISGGRPIWLLSQEGEGPAKSVDFEAPPILGKVVGRDRDGDDVINNRDGKKALILDPFQWQWGESSDGKVLREMLAETAGYDGDVGQSVEWHINQGVTPESFTGWSQFDLVHVSTHGARVCESDDPEFIEGDPDVCWSYLATGVKIASVTDYPRNQGYTSYIVDGDFVLDGIREINPVFLGLEADWFDRSPGIEALEKTFVFLNGCETYNRTGAVPDVMRRYFAGGGEAGLVAWTEAVPVGTAHEAARKLYEDMLENGLRLNVAYDRLKSDGKHVATNSSGTTTMLKPVGDTKLRLRELAILLEDGEEMADETDINDRVIGTVGDGDHDRLRLDLRVDGVLPENKDDFTVRYEVDGVSTAGSYNLKDATESGEFSYDVEHEVDLGLPLEGGSLELEAIVALPEGGESRFRVDPIVGDCWWRVEFDGPDNSGIYEGESISMSTEDIFSILLIDPAEIFPATTITHSSIQLGETARTFLLGRAAEGGDGEGQFAITFQTASYFSGDGTEVQNLPENAPPDTYPPPSMLTLEKNQDSVVVGNVFGELWSFGTGEHATPLRRGNVTVDFKASVDPETGVCE